MANAVSTPARGKDSTKGQGAARSKSLVPAPAAERLSAGLQPNNQYGGARRRRRSRSFFT